MSKKKKKLFNKNNFQSCESVGRVFGKTQEVEVTIPQDLLDEGRPVRTMAGGLGNTPPIEPSVQRNVSFGEKAIYFGNAGIIMGPQRNTNELSGEGASGFPSDTIDLVVGFNDGGTPCDGTIVNVNTATDAARVYVSRSVRVDTMFGVARSIDEGEAEKPLSAVVMKADRARVIGRQGIKLVTGRQQGLTGAGQKGERNSKGGDYQQSATIDLIAGNNIESHHLPLPELMRPYEDLIGIYIPSWEPKYNYLQPAVLGDNLRICLSEVADMIESSWNAQMTINIALMTVFSSISKGFMAIPGAQPLSAATEIVAQLLKSYGPDAQWSVGQQLQLWHKNFLDPTAKRYISSVNVNLT